MQSSGSSGSSEAGYGERFYNEIGPGSQSSARVVLPLIFDIVRPTSVVDVGCGVGTWLAAAIELGVDDVVGFDRAVPRQQLRIAEQHYVDVDLSQGLPIDRRFDLAISLEVAEHLPAERAASLVSDLCSLADAVLFSAAVTGQGGQDHINEQWQSWWVRLFAEEGYAVLDPVRPATWTDARVEPWYSQNTLLFVRRTRADMLERAAHVPAALPLDLVHPLLWEVKLRALRPLSARAAAQAFVSAIRGRVTSKVQRIRSGRRSA